MQQGVVTTSATTRTHCRASLRSCWPPLKNRYYDRNFALPGVSWAYTKMRVFPSTENLGHHRHGPYWQSLLAGPSPGMNIIYNNRNRLIGISKKNTVRHVSFDELIETADFISLNAHHFQPNMIGKEQFNRMSPLPYYQYGVATWSTSKRWLMHWERKIWAAGLDVYQTVHSPRATRIG